MHPQIIFVQLISSSISYQWQQPPTNDILFYFLMKVFFNKSIIYNSVYF